MSNSNNLKPFQESDSRINRRGRPRHYDLFRTLAREISNELITEEISGETMTRIEAIIRDWATSKEFHKQLAFVEYAFGKVPKNETPDRDVTIVVDWGRTVDDGNRSTSIIDYPKDDDPPGRPPLPASA